MTSFIYWNLNSKIVVKLWNNEYTVYLVIYEAKEISDLCLYFSNQTQFDL